MASWSSLVFLLSTFGVPQEPVREFAVIESQDEKWAMNQADMVSWNPRNGQISVSFIQQNRILVLSPFMAPIGEYSIRKLVGLATDGKSCSGPGGRVIKLDKDNALLRQELAAWEKDTSIDFGPNYAIIEVRCSKVMEEPVVWVGGDGSIRRSYFECDRWDPLIKRAYLHGISSGGELVFSAPSAEYQFPPQYVWRKLKIPKQIKLGDLEPQLISTLEVVARGDLSVSLPHGIFSDQPRTTSIEVDAPSRE